MCLLKIPRRCSDTLTRRSTFEKKISGYKENYNLKLNAVKLCVDTCQNQNLGTAVALLWQYNEQSKRYSFLFIQILLARSLEMEEERHYNETVMSGAVSIRGRTVSSPVPYNPSPSCSRPLSPGTIVDAVSICFVNMWELRADCSITHNSYFLQETFWLVQHLVKIWIPLAATHVDRQLQTCLLPAHLLHQE